MTKKPFIWFTLLLCMLLPLLAACGSQTPSNTSTNPATNQALPVGENIYLLDGYAPQGVTNTNQHIVAFHPGNNQPAYTLPAGLTSIDHRLLIVAQAEAGQTTVSVIDTRNGTTLRSLALAGSYSTAGQDFNNAVLSYDGHWLALRQLGSSTSYTTIALVDTWAGKAAQVIHLSGDFDLDAIDPTASALYLLERWHDGSGKYDVRRYDVLKHSLYETQIVDKTELNDPNMTGRAVARQMASDGRTVYTLYIDTYHNIAFVHILPLDPTFPFARCVVLSVGKSAALLNYYTLALSADGSTLYAANGALGIASAITLNNGSVADIFDDKIAATQHFNAGATNLSNADTSRVLRNGAALSSDQSTLYFAGLRGIWSVKTADLLSGHAAFHQALGQQSFTGIALSADSKTLYAVSPASGISAYDTASGQAQQAFQVPARSPWSIEWIAN